MHSALKPRLIWLAIPAASPFIYAIWLHYTLSRDTKSESGQVDTSKLAFTYVPEEVPTSDSNTLVFHETVSKAIPKDSLSKEHQADLDTLLTTFLRANMQTFARLPQAMMLKRLMSAPQDRATFESLHLDTISFLPLDRVCGVYLIVRREDQRIELVMDAPDSYRGPVFKGVMVIGLQERQGEIMFMNDLWMWRKKNEAKVPIEGGIGGWMHLFFVKWLVDKETRLLMKQ
jgi:hypothetical protein